MLPRFLSKGTNRGRDLRNRGRGTDLKAGLVSLSRKNQITVSPEYLQFSRIAGWQRCQSEIVRYSSSWLEHR